MRRHAPESVAGPEHVRLPGRSPAPKNEPGPAGTLHAGPAPHLDTGTVLRLQRAAGNAAVSGFLGRAEVIDPAALGDAAPLPSDLRSRMEMAFGADFSAVRVHAGAEAGASAAALGARAYTIGEDIVAGDGGTDERTIAHELAHVVQQREGPVDGTDRGDGIAISDPGDSFEQAADVAAARIDGGAATEAGAAAPSVPATSSRSTAQRATSDERELAASTYSSVPDPDVPGMFDVQETTTQAGGGTLSQSTSAMGMTTLSAGSGPATQGTRSASGGTQSTDRDAGGDTGSSPQAEPAAAAANPVLAAMWDHSVQAPLRAAADAMSDPRPDYRVAFDSAGQAREAARAAVEPLPKEDPRIPRATYLLDDLLLMQTVLAPRANVTISTTDDEAAGKLGEMEYDAQVVGESLGGNPAPRQQHRPEVAR